MDFSEEKEEKGYVVVDLARGQAQVEFCPLPVRVFRTLEVDVTLEEKPQDILLAAFLSAFIEDAVVRLIYKLHAEQIDLIDNTALGDALAKAHTYTIQPVLVSQLARPRLPELGVGGGIEPIVALQTYLANREDLIDIADDMLRATESLLAQDPEPYLEAVVSAPGKNLTEDSPPESDSQQLRLL